MNILTKTFLLWLKMNILMRLVSMQLKTTDKNKEKKVRNVQALLDMDDHTIREKIIDCISQLNYARPENPFYWSEYNPEQLIELHQRLALYRIISIIVIT